jgi:hypothetical protein
VVAKDDKDEQDTEACGGHGEKVDRDQVGDMVGEERAPGLRGLGARFCMSRALADGELLAQGEVFEGELAAADEEGEEAKQFE